MANTKNILQDAKKRKAEELLRANRLQEASAAFEQLCRQNPGDYDLWLNLGVIYGRLRRFDAAETAFRRALSLRNDEPHIYINLARLCDLQGRFDEEINHCRNYLRLRPNDAEAHTQMGKLLHKQGRLLEAEQALREALRCNPNDAAYYNNAGIVLCDLGRYDEALEYYRAALRLNPEMDEVYCNLGYLYHNKDEERLAEENYAAAVKVNPHNATALKHLGDYCLMSGRYDEAMHYFEETLRIEPDRAGAHWNIALLLLLAGNLRDGWRKYEWRFRHDEIKHPEITARYSSKPLWDGSLLSGQTLFVYAEQGFGDTLQFCRYLPLVRQRVEHVVFECQPELFQLLRRSFAGIEVIERRRGTLLPEVSYDLQIPLLSLPRLFETGINTIPNKVPYVHAPSLQIERWGERIDSRDLKVGLVWAGNPNYKVDQKRSLSLKSFAPLGQFQKICFYGLQKGPAAAEAVAPPDGMRLIDLASELDDFATTAAVIANLDLVITVDTAVAHLAGAMGKSVWALIYSPPDWRWLLDRDDTPWYPTMHLFRQAVPGEWGPVIEMVAEALQEECAIKDSGIVDGDVNG